MADPASFEAQEEARDKVDMAAVAAEAGVLAVIAQRLGRITPDSTQNDAADWAHYDERDTAEAMAKGRAMVDSAVSDVFSELGKGNDEWAEQFYSATGKARSNSADAALIDGRKAAKKRVGELCRTSVVGIVDDAGQYAPLFEGYRAVVSRSVAAMALGKAPYEQEVARAVRALSRHGVMVRYASGAVRELFAAVDTNVMDGYRVTMAAQRIEHGKAFGADGVEVSAHDNCAPDHLPFQGRRFSNEQWAHGAPSTLSRRLVTGANCHHTVSPVIIGIGESAWKDRLGEMNRRSEEAVTFKGAGGKDLTMTRYEATQYQRRIEREIRRSKMEANLMDKAGLPRDAAYADARAKSLTAYYRSMSAKTGLPMRPRRTKLYVAR